jgi:hypothetical protein
MLKINTETEELYVDPVAKLVKFKMRRIGYDMPTAAHEIDLGYGYLQRFLKGHVRWSSFKAQKRAGFARFLNIDANALDVLNECFHPERPL